MKILRLSVEKPFKYLWLKSVIDVDLDSHCAKCLVGKYCKDIKVGQGQYSNIILDENIYCLCGVALPFNYYNNFHLAFKAQKGEFFNFSDKGISVEIQNAVRLPISELYVDNDHPNSKKKAFYTCRNWQFAHYFNDYLR